MAQTDLERREKSDDKMKGQGLKKIRVWVHESNENKLKAYARKLVKPAKT